MSFYVILSLTLVAIVAFDTAACVLSRRLGFNYAYATIGSMTLYAIGGFAAAKTARFEAACLLGVVAGLTDATLGWRISWVLGPGRLPGGRMSASEWLNSAAVCIGLSVTCAAAGAWLATRL